MSLSDKIYDILDDGDQEKMRAIFMKAFNRYHPEGKALILNIEDVREAVRELKESLKEGIDDYTGADYKAIIAKIDEIFGEKLI